MRVLLVGEFSGVHNHLKRGLLTHGVDVTTVNTNDAWKQFPSDIVINSNAARPLGVLANELGLGLRRFARSAPSYDVVQLINPIIANTLRLQLAIGSIHLHTSAIKSLLGKSKRSFLLGAGDDKYYFDACANGRFKYNPVPAALRLDMPRWKRIYSQCWTRGVLRRWNVDLANRVNGIIPCAYEYAVAYGDSNLPNVRRMIRFPFCTAGLPAPTKRVRNVVRVLHTPTRPGFKGTPLILRAFDDLRGTLPNVEFVIGGATGIVDYARMLETVDIVVDQVYSYSYAMNALYSMAMGKVVLSGFEPEAQSLLGVPACAGLINVRPSVAEIKESILIAIDRVRSSSSIGSESRDFVEAFHNANGIAAEYIEEWNRAN
jgi:glycosyltransferase involved in cell wall biosynthesis